MKDLNKHAHSTFTNLNEADSKEIEALVTNSKIEGFNSFIDFSCSKCKKPIRIYYLSWAGGRFTNGYVIKYVID